MMFGTRRSALLFNSAVAALTYFGLGAAYAADPVYQFDIPAETLGQALSDFSQTSSQQIIFSNEVVAGRKSAGLQGSYTSAQALNSLLAGTDLKVQPNPSGVLMVQSKNVQAAPNEGAASTDLSNRNTIVEAGPSRGIEEAVVTASRVVRSGYQAPTPTTVLNEAQLNRSPAVNIFDQINMLPAFSGSWNQAINVSNVGGGLMGTNTLNLRNLGQTRTLILLDGQRIAPTLTNGMTDINTIPNALIKRVDVVNGGASASWGSDAVAGVVNFILDKDFTGVKGEVGGGVSTYGDDASYKMNLSVGSGFADNRGHFLASVEDSYNAQTAVGSRPWANVGRKIITNPDYQSGNGLPQYLRVDHAGYTTIAPGSIVSSGPLRGLYFGPNGVPAQFQYGALTNDPLTVGGDWKLTDLTKSPMALDPEVGHQSAYTRLSYNVYDDIEVYADFNFVHNRGYDVAYPMLYTGLTIQQDNAFLPSQVAARMAGLNLSSLTIGTSNYDLGGTLATAENNVFRYSAGVNGAFQLLDSHWTWDLHGSWNDSKIFNSATIANTRNLLQAIDAVGTSSGQIVCRSTLASPNNGCVPYDILGTGVASAAGKAYVLGNSELHQDITQEDYTANLRGEPVSTWAGPVSIATGLEHRRLAGSGSSDPLSQQGAFLYGNYQPIIGSYTVDEAYLETVVPLIRDVTLVKSLEFSGAVRGTNYSTSGYVTTWKVGASYAPTDDVRFRFTRSRDIRAGILPELFSKGSSAVLFFQDPANGNSSYQMQDITGGNPHVKPEMGDYVSFGTVIQPEVLPGLEASVDYWDINVRDAISEYGPQTVINQCYQGVQVFCGSITRGPDGLIQTIRTNPINVARQVARGIDFEASYRFPLSVISNSLGDGDLSFRAVATRNLKNVYYDGISPPNDQLNIPGGPTDWQYLTQMVYSNGPVEAAITGRGNSGYVQSPAYIQCSTNCPVSTLNNPTISNNSYPAPFYLDLYFSYAVTPQINWFASVKNVNNYMGGMMPRGPGLDCCGAGEGNQAYDNIGRYFRMGVRFND